MFSEQEIAGEALPFVQHFRTLENISIVDCVGIQIALNKWAWL
jgi:hypothetical protein